MPFAILKNANWYKFVRKKSAKKHTGYFTGVQSIGFPVYMEASRFRKFSAASESVPG